MPINQERIKEIEKKTDFLIKHSPAIQGKLRVLGLEDTELVEKRLKEIEKEVTE